MSTMNWLNMFQAVIVFSLIGRGSPLWDKFRPQLPHASPTPAYHGSSQRIPAYLQVAATPDSFSDLFTNPVLMPVPLVLVRRGEAQMDSEPREAIERATQVPMRQIFQEVSQDSPVTRKFVVDPRSGGVKVVNIDSANNFVTSNYHRQMMASPPRRMDTRASPAYDDPQNIRHFRPQQLEMVTATVPSKPEFSFVTPLPSHRYEDYEPVDQLMARSYSYPEPSQSNRLNYDPRASKGYSYEAPPPSAPRINYDDERRVHEEREAPLKPRGYSYAAPPPGAPRINYDERRAHEERLVPLNPRASSSPDSYLPPSGKKELAMSYQVFTLGSSKELRPTQAQYPSPNSATRGRGVFQSDEDLLQGHSYSPIGPNPFLPHPTESSSTSYQSMHIAGSPELRGGGTNLFSVDHSQQSPTSYTGPGGPLVDSFQSIGSPTPRPGNHLSPTTPNPFLRYSNPSHPQPSIGASPHSGVIEPQYASPSPTINPHEASPLPIEQMFSHRRRRPTTIHPSVTFHTETTDSFQSKYVQAFKTSPTAIPNHDRQRTYVSPVQISSTIGDAPFEIPQHRSSSSYSGPISNVRPNPVPSPHLPRHNGLSTYRGPSRTSTNSAPTVLRNEPGRMNTHEDLPFHNDSQQNKYVGPSTSTVVGSAVSNAQGGIPDHDRQRTYASPVQSTIGDAPLPIPQHGSTSSYSGPIGNIGPSSVPSSPLPHHNGLSTYRGPNAPSPGGVKIPEDLPFHDDQQSKYVGPSTNTGVVSVESTTTITGTISTTPVQMQSSISEAPLSIPEHGSSLSYSGPIENVRPKPASSPFLPQHNGLSAYEGPKRTSSNSRPPVLGKGDALDLPFNNDSQKNKYAGPSVNTVSVSVEKTTNGDTFTRIPVVQIQPDSLDVSTANSVERTTLINRPSTEDSYGVPGGEFLSLTEPKDTTTLSFRESSSSDPNPNSPGALSPSGTQKIFAHPSIQGIDVDNEDSSTSTSTSTGLVRISEVSSPVGSNGNEGRTSVTATDDGNYRDDGYGIPQGKVISASAENEISGERRNNPFVVKRPRPTVLVKPETTTVIHLPPSAIPAETTKSRTASMTFEAVTDVAVGNEVLERSEDDAEFSSSTQETTTDVTSSLYQGNSLEQSISLNINVIVHGEESGKKQVTPIQVTDNRRPHTIEAQTSKTVVTTSSVHQPIPQSGSIETAIQSVNVQFPQSTTTGIDKKINKENVLTSKPVITISNPLNPSGATDISLPAYELTTNSGGAINSASESTIVNTISSSNVVPFLSSAPPTSYTITQNSFSPSFTSTISPINVSESGSQPPLEFSDISFLGTPSTVLPTNTFSSSAPPTSYSVSQTSFSGMPSAISPIKAIPSSSSAPPTSYTVSQNSLPETSPPVSSISAIPNSSLEPLASYNDAHSRFPKAPPTVSPINVAVASSLPPPSFSQNSFSTTPSSIPSFTPSPSSSSAPPTSYTVSQNSLRDTTSTISPINIIASSSPIPSVVPQYSFSNTISTTTAPTTLAPIVTSSSLPPTVTFTSAFLPSSTPNTSPSSLTSNPISATESLPGYSSTTNASPTTTTVPSTSFTTTTAVPSSPTVSGPVQVLATTYRATVNPGDVSSNTVDGPAPTDGFLFFTQPQYDEKSKARSLPTQSSYSQSRRPSSTERPVFTKRPSLQFVDQIVEQISTLSPSHGRGLTPTTIHPATTTTGSYRQSTSPSPLATAAGILEADLAKDLLMLKAINELYTLIEQGGGQRRQPTNHADLPQVTTQAPIASVYSSPPLASSSYSVGDSPLKDFEYDPRQLDPDYLNDFDLPAVVPGYGKKDTSGDQSGYSPPSEDGYGAPKGRPLGSNEIPKIRQNTATKHSHSSISSSNAPEGQLSNDYVPPTHSSNLLNSYGPIQSSQPHPVPHQVPFQAEIDSYGSPKAPPTEYANDHDDSYNPPGPLIDYAVAPPSDYGRSPKPPFHRKIPPPPSRHNNYARPAAPHLSHEYGPPYNSANNLHHPSLKHTHRPPPHGFQSVYTNPISEAYGIPDLPVASLPHQYESPPKVPSSTYEVDGSDYLADDEIREEPNTSLDYYDETGQFYRRPQDYHAQYHKEENKGPEYYEVTKDLIPDLEVVAKPLGWDVRDFGAWEHFFEDRSSSASDQNDDEPKNTPVLSHLQEVQLDYITPDYESDIPQLENPFRAYAPNLEGPPEAKHTVFAQDPIKPRRHRRRRMRQKPEKYEVFHPEGIPANRRESHVADDSDEFSPNNGQKDKAKHADERELMPANTDLGIKYDKWVAKFDLSQTGELTEETTEFMSTDTTRRSSPLMPRRRRRRRSEKKQDETPFAPMESVKPLNQDSKTDRQRQDAQPVTGLAGVWQWATALRWI